MTLSNKKLWCAAQKGVVCDLSIISPNRVYIPVLPIRGNFFIEAKYDPF